MHTWETLHRYAQFHDRWFEVAEAYSPGDEHLAVFRRLMPDTWVLRRFGMNVVAEPPGSDIPEQGWKLHISARSRDSAAVLSAVLPILRDTGTHFKFIADRHLTSMQNSKTWSRGAAGKFITVYPRTDEVFLLLAQQLTEALLEFSGPYVLSDRRVPGSRSVFYRYGGFRARWDLLPEGYRSACIVTPDGAQIPDIRHPYFNPPDWARDPFGEQEGDLDEETQDGAMTLAEGRFVVKDALGFTNRGGVYHALDVETGREVVLKEARPGVELDGAGTEAIATLEKEYNLLVALRGSGLFARPVTFFHEWEHAFLVEEYLDGEQLGLLAIADNPLYRVGFTQADLDAYHARLRPLWRELAEAIGFAHRHGILLGDISFTNIIVTRDEDGAEHIKLIDLETAVRPGLDPSLGIHTRGLASERLVRTGVSDEANDWHALGGIILGSVVLLHSFLGFNPGALGPLLDSLTADLGLPAALSALIRDLRDPAWEHDAEAVCARIDALAAVPTAPRTALLTRPARESLTGERLDVLREQVSQTVDGVVRQLVDTADPRREDRLFPADPLVFETNPMSVAFGACGVAYALNRLTGSVPAPVRGWLLRGPVVDRDVPPGLYLGQAGIAWVLDELGHPELALRLVRDACGHRLVSASPGVLVGDAGLGLACLHLWQRTHEPFLLEEAARIGALLLNRRERAEQGSYWRDAAGKIPVGYARGASGVAAFLLYLSLATGDTGYLAVGRDALDFDLSQARELDGRFAGFPGVVDQPGGEANVLKGYWDEGTAGVVTTAVRYLSVQQDPALRSALSTVVPETHRKYAVLPQLFHGLAGLGNVLLDLWEFTGDDDHFHEAWRVAEGIVLFRSERADGYAFPGEQALRESTDLASGSAGVGLFLHRLLHARPGGRTNFNFLPDALLPTGTWGYETRADPQ